MNYSGTQIALIAEVKIDRNTGKLRVPKIWAALDPGIAVQPDNVIAQTESSVVYGLGFALSERITIDGRRGAGVRTSTTTTCRA